MVLIITIINKSLKLYYCWLHRFSMCPRWGHPVFYRDSDFYRSLSHLFLEFVTTLNEFTEFVNESWLESNFE